jgi:hypothetical protein
MDWHNNQQRHCCEVIEIFRQLRSATTVLTNMNRPVNANQKWRGSTRQLMISSLKQLRWQ